MKIKYGKGKTKYGPGVEISLTEQEIAVAIEAYLVAHRIYIYGPQTISINGSLCHEGSVYVDPSGFVITPKGKKISGKGMD